MGLLKRLRGGSENEEPKPDPETKTYTTELRRVITNYKSTLIIEGEDDRSIEYDENENGHFKMVEDWHVGYRGLSPSFNGDEWDLCIRISEYDRVLDVNHQYLKAIDPVWEHNMTLVAEAEVTYTEYPDKSPVLENIEVLDKWTEGGDTTNV